MHVTHCQYNESVHQKEEHASLINTILIKISTLLTLESLKSETFASDMFTKLGVHEQGLLVFMKLGS